MSINSLHLAANYSLFEQPRAMPGAFESNDYEWRSLQDTVMLEPYAHPQILVQNKGSKFKGDFELKLKPDRVPKSDNLTHWYFQDGSPMPLVPMSMGEIRSNAGLDRVEAVSIQETRRQEHIFTDRYYLKDNKTGQ